jgi:hypothetical protein
MPPVKSGSNVAVRSSAPAERPARSTGGFAARSSTASPRARFPAVVLPAVCTHTTSGTGKTAAPPSWPTWCCYALITTGCTIGASSPSPDPQSISPSPTAPADHSPRDRSRVRPTFPRPPSHRASGPPASAPTGGGTNPFSRSHRQHTTRLVRHRAEAETAWGIENFVCAIRCYPILSIKADNQACTAADPIPRALIKIPADGRTNLS